MEYGKIKYVDKPVSCIAFGTATPVMFNAIRARYGDCPDFKRIRPVESRYP